MPLNNNHTPKQMVEALALTKSAKISHAKGFKDETAIFLINAFDLLNEVTDNDILKVRIFNRMSRTIEIDRSQIGNQPCLNASISNIFKIIRVLDVKFNQKQRFIYHPTGTAILIDKA